MTSDSSTTRRAYLRVAGATAAAAVLGGCSQGDSDPPRTEGTPTETPGTTATGTRPGTTGTRSETTTGTRGPGDGPTTESPDADPTAEPTTAEYTTYETSTTRPVTEDRFETVVNVADAGADRTGGIPINPVLDRHVGNDTMLYFPPGRYRLDEWTVTGYTNLGIVGEDAVLVPPKGVNYWLQWGDLRDFSFAGFEIDCRRTGVAPVVYLSVAGGTSVVRNVSLRGHRRLPRSGFEVAAADSDAVLRFENVSLPDGSTDGDAVYVFPRSVGELTFRNCRIEHWAEGLYAAYHSGPLRVLGGYYANNGIDQVRVGGGTSGALVRGVTVRVDDPRRARHKPNMRGIWLEEGGHARIENCDVAITDLTGTYSSGGIVVGKQFGAATIRNTRVRTDANAFAIQVRDPIDSMRGQTVPSMDRLPERTRVVCRDVRISGTATRGTAVKVTRRDDCLLERVCVQHSRGSRDGVGVEAAEGCAVRDSTIDVSGEAIATDGATVRTRRIRTDGSC